MESGAVRALVGQVVGGAGFRKTGERKLLSLKGREMKE